ncbi:MAG: helix-turn-helix transcriptional regulator [Bacteroidales bacterium]|nr:helix-turn-helix transcriptional regulator [Bacteroidales bacterium]
MKKCLLLCLAALTMLPAAGYNDHRGHNLDSLERAVARWTPDAVDKASTEELAKLNRAYRDLMLGYNVLNGEKSDFYARKALAISRAQGWAAADADAYRYIGLHFYGSGQYDSAMVYFQAALAATDQMAAGALSPTDPEGYTEQAIDDAYSSLYGTVGNLYNVMDSIPQAMAYYEKAGALFEKHGWNESNSILHYNIGETWMDEGDLKRATLAYDKALGYAEASGDSLMIVDAWKGFGRLYMEQGKPWKSLPYLRKADAYYAVHPDDSPGFRTENLDFMKEVLSRQKLLLGRLVGVLVGLALVALGWWAAKRIRHSKRVQAEAASVALTERELQVLQLIANGKTNPQIAELICLSPETVGWYRKKLRAKLGAANTAELVSIAKEKGLV